MPEELLDDGDGDVVEGEAGAVVVAESVGHLPRRGSDPRLPAQPAQDSVDVLAGHPLRIVAYE